MTDPIAAVTPDEVAAPTERPLTVLLRRAKKVGWTGLDQILSSLSNFLISLALARYGGARSLGEFTLAFSVYTVGINVARTAVAEPLLATVNDRTDERSAENRAFTCVLVFAIIGGLGAGVAGLATHHLAIAAMGLAAPWLLGQDVLRYIAFSRGLPAQAALLDAVWLAGTILTVPAIGAGAGTDASVLLWSAGAFLGFVLGAVRLTLRPAGIVRSLRWWWDALRPLAAFLVVDMVLFLVASQVLVFVVAGILGIDGVGYLRASQLIMAPLTVGITALSVALLPFAARRQSGFDVQAAIRLSVLVGGVIAFVAAVLTAASPLLGTILYGNGVQPSVLLVALTGLGLVFNAVGVALSTYAKVHKQGSSLLLARVVSLAFTVPVLLYGASAYGVTGTAWALVWSSVSFLVVLVAASVIRARRGPATAAPAPAESVTDS